MDSVLKTKYESLASMMNERLKRRWAASEAIVLGYGGISAVALATGLSRRTIRKGIAEVEEKLPDLAPETDECAAKVVPARNSLNVI
jgi:hypothetical protein